LSEQPNPYAPPGANLGPPPPKEKGSAFKALLFGFLVDIGLSLMVGVVFAILYGIYQLAIGKSMEEIGQFFTEPDPFSLSMMLLQAVGGACSFLGGFVCARVARHSELRLGATLAALTLVFGWVTNGGEQQPVLTLISSIVAVFSTMFGAWVGAWRNRRTG
jgi:hypothetical protein